MTAYHDHLMKRIYLATTTATQPPKSLHAILPH
jgi:hypothetical protein